MDLNIIEKAYYEKQRERINKLFARLLEQGDPTSPGRVVPDVADLVINEGRVVDAAVLFLDISGFSKRPSGDAKQQAILLQIITLYFTEMIRVIMDYGGTVEKNTGDGLMAYFTSDADGDARMKAVAAALSIFKAATDFIDPLVISQSGEPFKFRICIDHGPITIAKVGAPRLFNGIVAIGASANIASKMLAVAQGGELVIGQDVALGLRTDWVQQFVSVKAEESGWVRGTGVNYPFYLFIGRWLTP